MDLVNRVAQSNIVVYDLETLWDGREIAEFDIQPYLFHGLILKELDFRKALKEIDWTAYENRHVAVFCSADAVIPTWAFMLVGSNLKDVAASVVFGRRDDLIRDHFTRALAAKDWSAFQDQVVVVKGCNSGIVPVNAYVQAQAHLQGIARRLMYGEPCSFVPTWRRPSKRQPKLPARG
ncbi:MAG: DUF2480 family protein [Bacteroidota bacterium]